MNFCDLNGSKIDSNNLFENNQIYERFDNLQNNEILNEDYKCSNNYSVSGKNYSNIIEKSNLNDCKKKCSNAGSNCVGFNFDTSKNTCTLKNSASNLNYTPSNNVCIKKSAGNMDCKSNDKSNTFTKALNNLESIFNYNESNNETPPEPPNNKPLYPSPNIQNLNDDIIYKSEMELYKNNIENNMGNNMGNNPGGIYVDLDCFMKNIKVLQNRIDENGMLVDLSLLLSNIKTCSYVKKDSINKEKINSKQLLSQVTSKIEIPQPDVIKLKNIKADLLIADTPLNSVLEVIKEPFSTNSESSNIFSYDSIKIIIIILILVLLIFKK